MTNYASGGNFTNKVTVELSPEDRAILKSIAKALGVTDDESFADSVGQLVSDVVPSTERRPRRLIDDVRFQAPLAEGEWLLKNDEHEGEDLD